MSKPYLSIEQQLRNLVNNKHLIIDDEAAAKEALVDIGYFSLIGGYKSSFINLTTHKYEIPTSFDDILNLYRFDEKLRELTFAYLSKIEQKIQQLIADSFCSVYGEKQTFYLDPKSYSQNPRYSSQISKLIRILGEIANRNTNRKYLVYQREAYNNVPLWVATHAMTFGQISNMYLVLRQSERIKVSKAYLNVSEKALEQYLSALTLFRNTCAHEECLFSFRLEKRSFPDTPLHMKMGIPKKGNQYTNGKTDYFGLIIAFRYLLRKEDFVAYKRELRKLINSYCKGTTRISKPYLLSQMGIPENWETITRYKL